MINLIIYENGEYTPCTYRVILQNRGVEETHYANFRTYWEDMVAKHEYLTNLSFEEITFSAEQDARLQEISELNIPQGFQAEVKEYVENGNFPEGLNNPLAGLKYKKEMNDAYKMILESEGLI